MTFRMVLPMRFLREFTDSVGALVTECRVHLDKECMWVSAVDTANVALVHAQLFPPAFTTYFVGDGGGIVALDLPVLMQILSVADDSQGRSSFGQDDPVELTQAKGSKEVKINFGRYRCEMKSLDEHTVRRDPNPPPQVCEQNAKAILPGHILREAVMAASRVSDKVELGIQPTGFYALAIGDTNRVRFDYPAGEGRFDYEARDGWILTKATSSYAIDYLRDLVKKDRPLAMARQVEVHLRTDWPMRLIFEIADENGKVTYSMAPQIEDKPGGADL